MADASDLVRDWSPYVHWSKVHEKTTWELSGSNLLAASRGDLPNWESALELSGANDEGWPPLVEAIAGHYRVETKRVATGTGASAANFMVIAALVRAGEEILVESPGYDPHSGAARLVGAGVATFERRFDDGWRIDPDRVEAALTPWTRLIVVTNAHNPSGVVATEEELRALVEVAERHGVHVLVDEVYLDVSPDRPPYAASLSDRMISTSSLTKSYGFSGLRAGWVVGSPEVAAAVRRVRDVVDCVGPFPTERLAALAFERLPELAARATRILDPNRGLVHAFVDAHDMLEWVIPTSGAVAFPRIRGLDDAGPFVDRLRREYEVGLVPGAFFGTPAHFRIAMGGAKDILAGGLRALGRAMDEEAWMT